MSIIKSFSVGNGDMFYIEHGSDNFTIIDCCVDDATADEILNEIKNKQNKKGITRFISTHPDEDHIRGIELLDDKIKIINFYCVKNNATKEDESDSFKRYCELRDSEKAYYISKGCKRRWMNESNEERGGSGINISWPNTSNTEFKAALQDAEDGLSPNNISPVVEYIGPGGLFTWMGDLETEFMEATGDEMNVSKAKVLFAPHHGRDSGKVPSFLLGKIDPEIIVIGEAPSEHLNYYNGYNTITQNSAGDITFDCGSEYIDIYVSKKNYSVTFLKNRGLPSKHGGFYLGSLKV